MNRLSLLLTAILFLFLINNISSQITISGTITDPAFKPIGNAVIEITDNNNETNKYTAKSDANGSFLVSNITDIEFREDEIPKEYLLLGNYPNPFNPTTVIYFELPKAENIELKIYDILGKQIRTLFTGFHNAGKGRFNWDGKNDLRQPVSSGVYLCKLTTGKHFKVHKMLFLDGGSYSSGSLNIQISSKKDLLKAAAANSRFNFSVKVSGDSVDNTYYKNLICSGDTTLNLIASKIIERKIIGTNGGTIGAGEIKISIPSGFFNESNEISLINIEDDGAFGDNTVSSSFKLKGFENSSSKPFKIITKYSGNLSESSFLCIGTMQYYPLQQDSSLFYKLAEAHDSSGFLISEVTIDTASIRLQKSFFPKLDLSIFLKNATNLRYSSTPHFSFNYPNLPQLDMINIASIFENAFYLVYNGLLYNTHIPNYDSWDYDPLEVTLSKSEKKVTDSGSRSNQSFNVDLNLLLSGRFSEIESEVAQKLFLPSKLFDEKTFWGDLLIYFWIENLYNEELEYHKNQLFLANALAPFNSFKAKAGLVEMTSHGLGMSVFLKYLFEVKKIDIKLIRLYLLSQRTSVYMNQIVQWWPDFFAKYINNELYTLPDDYFINRAHAEWNINSAADSLKIFASNQVGNYKDLSAKMFKLNLNYAELDTSKNLLFKISGAENNSSFLLFKEVDNKLVFIDSTRNAEFDLEKPKSHFENGTGSFLVVLVNCNIKQDDFYGESEIDLEIRLKSKNNSNTGILSYTKANLRASLWGQFENKWADGSLHYSEEQFGMNVPVFLIGKFEGNIFHGADTLTGTFIPTDVTEFYLTVELNKTLDTVLTFSILKVTTFNNEFKEVRTEEIIGGNIPINTVVDGFFEIKGTDVCSCIYSAVYNDVFYITDGSENYYKLLNIGCTEESLLQIRFIK